MGFPIVEIRLPECDGGLEAKLLQWLVPINTYVDRNQPIAEVLFDGVLHRLICTMPMAISETCTAIGGSIAPDQVLARALAEGHEIPYGRHFTRLEQAS